MGALPLPCFQRVQQSPAFNEGLLAGCMACGTEVLRLRLEVLSGKESEKPSGPAVQPHNYTGIKGHSLSGTHVPKFQS